MNARIRHSLEVITFLPAVPRYSTPLLFVHGAHSGAWCWAEHFLPWFAEQGWTAHALSLSGHAGSPGHEYLDTLSIDHYVADLGAVIADLPEVPVLIGHSMGGFVVQKYLERHRIPGAALLCAVPPQGMFGPALGLALRRPNLLFDLNRLAGGGAIGPDALLEAMFHQPLPPELLERYFRRMQGESQRAVWDMMGFNLPRPVFDNCPEVLVMGAEYDALIPTSGVRETAAQWGVEAHIVAGLGHGIMLEAGWRAAAQPLAEWLERIEE